MAKTFRVGFKIHHHPSGENYANTFRVNDWILEVNYSDYGTFDKIAWGHLFYEKPFFLLFIEWNTDLRRWLADCSYRYTYRN